MASKKPGKKGRKKKGAVNWRCDNPEEPYDLKTLISMLEGTPGFATFLFPVVKGALGYKAADIKCLESYLFPKDQELTDLGIPSWEVGGKSRCTDVGLLVAAIAEKHA